ncbi:hypothetical protein C0J52_17989 [Blattella germanica]|nr:hypothetical protein C0J52_17989 [Blattella germanica]
MGKTHPSFAEFLQKLQNEVAEVTRQILRLDTGGSPKKRKKTAVKTNRRVQRIVNRYQEYKNAAYILVSPYPGVYNSYYFLFLKAKSV